MWPFRKKKANVQVQVTWAEMPYKPPWEPSRVGRKAKQTLDRHFATMEKMQQAYYRREVDGLEPAIKLCNAMIALAPEAFDAFRKQDVLMEEWSRKYGVYKARKESRPAFRPPSHLGFKQLAIIRERQKDHEEVIRLCRQAAAQGWSGDWEVRIARCKQKLSKRGT